MITKEDILEFISDANHVDRYSSAGGPSQCRIDPESLKELAMLALRGLSAKTLEDALEFYCKDWEVSKYGEQGTTMFHSVENKKNESDCDIVVIDTRNKKLVAGSKARKALTKYREETKERT